MKRKTLTTFGFEKDANSNFFEMAIGNKGGFAYPVPEKSQTPKSMIHCFECDGIERRVLGNAVFKFQGAKEANIYHHPRYVLADEIVIRLLRKSNVIGYKTCDIYVTDSDKLSVEHTSQLKELDITGRCYKITTPKGETVNPCLACKKVPNSEKEKTRDGITVNLDDWDGSDIFMFDYGLLSIVVTKKVKDLFEAEGITNVEFKPLSTLTLL